MPNRAPGLTPSGGDFLRERGPEGNLVRGEEEPRYTLQDRPVRGKSLVSVVKDRETGEIGIVPARLRKTIQEDFEGTLAKHRDEITWYDLAAVDERGEALRKAA